MTAAVPDPRFRDQLAEPIDHDAAFCCGPGEEFVRNAHEALYAHEYRAATHHGILDALLPVVRAYGDARAAEVEARVQAAAKQGAAEVLRAAALEQLDEANAVPDTDEGTHADGHRCAADFLVRRANSIAALTSPAPAPHAEEGQR